VTASGIYLPAVAAARPGWRAWDRVPWHASFGLWIAEV